MALKAPQLGALYEYKEGDMKWHTVSASLERLISSGFAMSAFKVG